jgi:hypothetical protein
MLMKFERAVRWRPRVLLPLLIRNVWTVITLMELTPLVKYVQPSLIHLQENATLLLLLVSLPSLATLDFTKVVVQAVVILDVLRA